MQQNRGEGEGGGQADKGDQGASALLVWHGVGWGGKNGGSEENLEPPPEGGGMEKGHHPPPLSPHPPKVKFSGALLHALVFTDSIADSRELWREMSRIVEK